MKEQNETCPHNRPLSSYCLDCYKAKKKREAALERIKKQAKKLDW
jgi:hypothetical protein